MKTCGGLKLSSHNANEAFNLSDLVAQDLITVIVPKHHHIRMSHTAPHSVGPEVVNLWGMPILAMCIALCILSRPTPSVIKQYIVRVWYCIIEYDRDLVGFVHGSAKTTS